MSLPERSPQALPGAHCIPFLHLGGASRWFGNSGSKAILPLNTIASLNSVQYYSSQSSCFTHQKRVPDRARATNLICGVRCSMKIRVFCLESMKNFKMAATEHETKCRALEPAQVAGPQGPPWTGRRWGLQGDWIAGSISETPGPNRAQELLLNMESH